MKVLLVSANTETAYMPPLPLGMSCVAAAARKAGHDVGVVDLMYAKDAARELRERIGEIRPDVIGVSVRNIDDQNIAGARTFLGPIREMVAACRSACRAPVVLGGAGYSIFPESVLAYLGADMGIRGEGEAAFPALLERMAQGGTVADVPGVCLPGRPCEGMGFVKNLDDLPLPSPDGFLPRGVALRDLWVPVQSRRGCPMDCSYCSTSAIEGRPVRRRSPGRVAAWLGELAAAGCRSFHFVDNTFNLPPAYAKALCREIIRAGIDIRMWCIVYPKWVDAELVGLMADAGCRLVSLGFESGSDRMLERFGKRFSAEEVRAVSESFRRAGIERNGFLMLGGPGETRETVEESLSFADSLDLEALKVTIGVRIYPRTRLAEIAVRERVVDPGDDLLEPRFYLAEGMRGWLPERVAEYTALDAGQRIR